MEFFIAFLVKIPRIYERETQEKSNTFFLQFVYAQTS